MKAIFIFFISIFLINACATQPGNSAQNQVEQTTEKVTVSMLKYQFVPEVIEIKAGQSVRWINKEKRQYHSVWFEKSGGQESDYLFPDESWEKTFDKPGVYEYRCGPHPEMIGKVIVQ